MVIRSLRLHSYSVCGAASDRSAERNCFVTAHSRLRKGSGMTDFNFETFGYLAFKILLCLLSEEADFRDRATLLSL